ncbi:MAG: hypothetical protein JW969_18295, partial [Spirochaetales bacterium]|nr:hypothetical protein [Spirochaetales bacterium]
MKILVAGDWHSKIHEEPVFNAFVRLGHKVEKFSWFQYFRFDDLPPLLKQMGRFIGRAQNKFIWGSLIDRINRDFLKKVLSFKP